MKLITVAFLIAAFTGGVAAQEELVNAKQCWSLLPSHFGIGASVDLAVSLDGWSVRSVEVTAYKPDTEIGYRIATSALKAVEGCGPYGDFTGDVVMTFDVDAELPDPVGKPVPLPGKQ